MPDSDVPELPKHRVLLLASYCGTDDEHCNERHPCNDCLQMCNVFELDSYDLLANASAYGSLQYSKGRNKPL